VEGRFCTSCGAPVGASAGSEPPPASEQAPGTPPPPIGTPGGPQPAGLANNVAGALCYVLGLVTGILFLLLPPYNQDRNIRFHAYQSIFMHVGVLVLAIVVSIAIPWVTMLVWLGGLALWIYMIVKTYQNQTVKLPFIGDLAEKQG
jgi:uncharacterized membrane protein